ncbi:helix-turn-helix domain-containing protein [Nocardia cyriacigeorgica]
MSRADMGAVIQRITDAPTVSVDDAAAVLGIGRSTAYNGVASGEIPSIRVGRRVRVPSNWIRERLSLDDSAGVR